MVLREMSPEEFRQLNGYDPVNDDLDRVNCELVGKPGHVQCGVCKHGAAVFLGCDECTDGGQVSGDVAHGFDADGGRIVP